MRVHREVPLSVVLHQGRPKDMMAVATHKTVNNTQRHDVRVSSVATSGERDTEKRNDVRVVSMQDHETVPGSVPFPCTCDRIRANVCLQVGCFSRPRPQAQVLC